LRRVGLARLGEQAGVQSPIAWSYPAQSQNAPSTKRQTTRSRGGKPRYEADEWARREHFINKREKPNLFAEWKSKRKAEMERMGRSEVADWQDTWSKVFRNQAKDIG
jgi:hypothetical protein